MGNKRQVEVESLVRWTYRDELPKGYRDGKGGAPVEISPMFKWANLGGPVDNWSKEPGYPVAMGSEPHPDALAVHGVVLELEPVALGGPDGAAALLGELTRYMTDGERFAMASLQTSTAALVGMHARLGNRPIWHVDFKILRIIGRSRKSLLRNKSGRTILKAQGDLRPDVPVSEILAARFEYCAWHAGLTALAIDLNAILLDHECLPPAAPAEPWNDPGDDQPRILGATEWMDARGLASMRVTAQAPLPLKPKRKIVLPQLPAAEHGPVRHVMEKPNVATD